MAQVESAVAKLEAVVAKLQSGNAAIPAPVIPVSPAPAIPVSPAIPAPAIPVSPAAKPAPQKPPFMGVKSTRQFTVEYFDGTDPELPEDLSVKRIVAFFQCRNCTIRIPMKMKGISFQQCERVTIIVGDVIGVLELTSTTRAVISLTGACPSITVDKCDNVQINVSEASLDVQIIVAHSQGINVDVPDLVEEGNMIEFPVPEQIRVALKNRTPVHEVYVHE
jgi:adenylyl cyclase-associated protein